MADWSLISSNGRRTTGLVTYIPRVIPFDQADARAGSTVLGRTRKTDPHPPPPRTNTIAPEFSILAISGCFFDPFHWSNITAYVQETCPAWAVGCCCCYCCCCYCCCRVAIAVAAAAAAAACATVDVIIGVFFLWWRRARVSGALLLRRCFRWPCWTTPSTSELSSSPSTSRARGRRHPEPEGRPPPTPTPITVCEYGARGSSRRLSGSDRPGSLC